MSTFVHVFAAGSLLFLCGLAVHLSYSATRVFCFSHAAVISFAPYVSMVAVSHLGAPSWIAALAGVMFGAVPGFAYELVVGRWMRHRGIAGWQQMLASLGYFIVIQNMLALTFGDQAQLWLVRSSVNALSWFGGRITVARILLCGSAVFVAIAVWMSFSRTRIGIKIRATASSPELAEIMGVEVERIRMTAVMLSCTVAALAGVLAAADVDMTPGIGFSLFLAGMAAAIIGGMGSIGSLILGALLLAFCQQFAARFVHGSWIDSAAYFGLILVLIWKPLGFSGRRLKKVEV